MEISESALKEFFTEQNISYYEETVPDIPGAKLLKVCVGASIVCVFQ